MNWMYVQDELDVLVLDIVVGGVGVGALELADLALEGLGHGFGPIFLLGLLAQLVDILGLVHAELFLDGTELIVQVVLSLLLVHLGTDLALYVVLELEYLYLTVQHLHQFHRPDFEIAFLEQLDLLHGVLKLDAGGDEVDQEFVALDVLDGERGFCRQVRGELDDVQGQVLDGACQGTHLLVVLLGHGVLQVFDPGEHIGLRGSLLYGPQPFQPLENGGYSTVRHFDNFYNPGKCAYIIKVYE